MSTESLNNSDTLLDNTNIKDKDETPKTIQRFVAQFNQGLFGLLFSLQGKSTDVNKYE